MLDDIGILLIVLMCGLILVIIGEWYNSQNRWWPFKKWED